MIGSPLSPEFVHMEKLYIVVHYCVEGLFGEVIQPEVHFLIFNIRGVYIEFLLQSSFKEPLFLNPWNAFPVNWLGCKVAVDLFEGVIRDVVEDLGLIPDALVKIIFIDESLGQFVLKLLQFDSLHIPEIEHIRSTPFKPFFDNKHFILIFYVK